MSCRKALPSSSLWEGTEMEPVSVRIPFVRLSIDLSLLGTLCMCTQYHILKRSKIAVN